MAIRSPAVAQSKEQYLRQTRKSVYEFALSTTDLPGISAGKRIATPVCALVRNDMQKEGRVRGCKDAARNAMQKEERVRGCKDVWCVRCAEICRVSAVARASPHCHCEERSDVAIRSPCGRA